MATKRIHVVGGASSIGRWLIEHVFKGAGEIYCYDTDRINLTRLPGYVKPNQIVSPKQHRRESKAASRNNDYHAYRENFRSGDIIVFAVPMNQFQKSLSDVCKYIKSGSLLVACNSVQAPAIRALRKLTPKQSHFMGCHLLFAPTVRMPDGFTAVLTEHDKTPIKAEFAKLMTDSGLSIVSLSATDHDSYMAIVQALTHFCFANVL